MSYYGISVLITVLITSLTAFYLLYKAKELNLGILLSITVGSIVLGFSFSPAFKFLMGLFISESMGINGKIALVLSLIVAIIIFLLFICILSLIISIVIPKKFSSIDCGAYIDKFFSSIKNYAAGFLAKLLSIPGKLTALMKNNVKSTYNLLNKLKKPVDTTQIIDTMGIEKNENGILYPGTADVTETADIIAAVAEPDDINIYNMPEVYDEAYLDIPEILEAGSDLAETVAEEPVDEITIEAEMADNEIVDEVAADDEIVEAETADTEIVDEVAADDEIVEAETADKVTTDEVTADSSDQSEDTTVPEDISDVITEIPSEMAAEKPDIVEKTAQSLVVKAFESKDNGRKDLAIEYYMEALEHAPDSEMIFWIILDVCTLYKQLGLKELAQSILEGIVSEYDSVIKPEIKEEIIKNLK